MGDPKKPKNKYTTPRHPWSSEQLTGELSLVGSYGLRNKKELWRAETELSRIRKQARALLAAPPGIRERTSGFLMGRLIRMGLVSESSPVDAILSLKVEDLLERRLQSLVWRKGLCRSPYESRQLITHKRVKVGSRFVSKPSYIVSRDEESSISVVGAQVQGAAQ